MKIGILQAGHSPEVLFPEFDDYGELFVKLLSGHGFEFQIWSVVDNEFPASIGDADGWLITGSRHGVYEDHDWIAPLTELIRDIYAKGSPMVGVCFGHQIIAQALGGTVEKFDGGWSVGRVEYQLEGERTALNAWHQDQVVKIPDGAKVIGSSDFCKNAALVYDNRAWTIQPHPEFTSAFVAGLIRTRGKGVVPDDQLQAASALTKQPIDSVKVMNRIADFLLKNKKRDESQKASA